MLEYASTVKCVSVESERGKNRCVSYSESYANSRSNYNTIM